MTESTALSAINTDYIQQCPAADSDII